jgi:hypothetical protein
MLPQEDNVNKKLNLSKETLRALTDDDSTHIQGGVLVPTKNATTCDFTDGVGCVSHVKTYCNCA